MLLIETPLPADKSPVFVFISYSRTNKAFVERLIVDLKTRGINVWIDQQGLRPGTPHSVDHDLVTSNRSGQKRRLTV